ncbi:hypothetical protein ACELLULO517_10160 [Acidisoma cellulosilytica]|uniref:Uncharacterized protein n=1 Tax=Acidisoma cellulosilyticum TaxID=2802395 RepID=A0A963Z0H1_9PROT|nr:hypothetical protein [Acidisoma cellulosilyticum]MCB8880597.1 hypothetical protein [Acidisoma cellulosilyticum]
MRADGTFVETARDPGFTGARFTASWPPQGTPRGGLARGLVIAGVLAGAVVVVGLALSLALILVPIAIAAALIGYAALRFQMWRMRQNGSTMKGPLGPIMAQAEAMMRARRQGR